MMRKLLSGLLTLGVLAVLGLYVWLHREEIGRFVLVSPPALGLCAGTENAGSAHRRFVADSCSTFPSPLNRRREGSERLNGSPIIPPARGGIDPFCGT